MGREIPAVGILRGWSWSEVCHSSWIIPFLSSSFFPPLVMLVLEKANISVSALASPPADQMSCHENTWYINTMSMWFRLILSRVDSLNVFAFVTWARVSTGPRRSPSICRESDAAVNSERLSLFKPPCCHPSCHITMNICYRVYSLWIIIQAASSVCMRRHIRISCLSAAWTCSPLCCRGKKWKWDLHWYSKSIRAWDLNGLDS